MAKAKIEFAVAPDGVRIACASLGEGLPIVVMPAWISAVEVIMDRYPEDTSRLYGFPVQIIAMDKRGTGMSDSDIGDYTVETRTRDIEAVVEHFGLSQFVLQGASEGVAMSIRYAVDHPDRVLAMVLSGGYAHGELRPASVQDALLRVIRAEWGMGAEFLDNMFQPGATPAESESFRTMQLRAASAENAALLWEAMPKMDVSDVLDDVACPTLISHARGDRIVPYDAGLELARRIPGARFHTFESDRHNPAQQDLAEWRTLVGGFLAELPHVSMALDAAAAAAPGAAVQTILFTDLAGSTELQSRLGDQKAHQILRAHDAAARQSINDFRGREIKHTGDGLMAAFDSATDAVQCALTVRRDLMTYNDTHPGEEVLVRFGLNAGEPIAENDDLFGLSVTLAARLGDWGEPGRVRCSNVVRELLIGKGFEFEPLGAIELKGFEAPVAVFEVTE